MTSITAKNISIIYPLVGTDKRFLEEKQSKITPIGGKILEDNLNGIMALNNFSIRLKSGDRLGIHGHNGSGKSTLLRVLGGVYPPSKGFIKIDGIASGMFSLSLGINKESSGLQNIRFKALMRGLSSEAIADLIPQIVEFSDLGDYIHLPVKTYSSGMVMRLMFAIASTLKPDILLLDEWISAGDKAFKQKLDDKLEEMLSTTPIVIIASHNEKRLRTWANRFVHLNHGEATFTN